MYEVEKIKNDLERMLSEYRYNHSLNVAKVAEELAGIYNVDKEKAYLTGLVHDIAKEFTDEENKYYIKKYKLSSKLLKKEFKKILHAYVGASYLKDVYNLDDDICKAVYVHTVASPDMDLLAKILFVADKIEPNKDYIGIDEERELAYQDINNALILCLENNIKKLESKGKRPHKNTIKTLKKLTKEQMKNKKSLDDR